MCVCLLYSMLAYSFSYSHIPATCVTAFHVNAQQVKPCEIIELHSK